MNMVIFVISMRVLVKHTRNKFNKSAYDKHQLRTNVRLTTSLFAIMVLFGLTWILGAFTISEASLAFQILFAIFNSFQGFFIFVFYCVLSPEVRQLWLQAMRCAKYAQTSSSSSGAKKGYSDSKLPHSQRKQTRVSILTSKMGSTSTGEYPSSEIQLAENSSSTVISNDYVMQVPMEKEKNPLPNISSPPNTPSTHSFNSNTGEEQATSIETIIDDSNKSS